MDAFGRREEAFEKKFAHDEELQFKAQARRDKLLAAWAADKIGRTGPAAEAYVGEVLTAEALGSSDGVFQKIRSDLDQARVEISDHQLRRQMDELLQIALAETKMQG